MIIAIDTETTGLRPEIDTIFGIGFVVSDRPAGANTSYIDVRTEPDKIGWLRENIPKAELVVAHNIKFDCPFLRQVGVLIRPEQMYCTMLVASCIDEHLPSYTLDDLSQRYLQDKKFDDIWPILAGMFGGKKTLKAQIGNLPRAPRALVAHYCMKDADLAMKLYLWQQAEIARQGIQSVIDFERVLIPPMIAIEAHGVRIDEAELDKAITAFTIRQTAEQVNLNIIAGFDVNVSQRAHMIKIFGPEATDDGWMVDGIDIAKTPKGAASINAASLRMLSHPAAKAVIALRKTTRILDVFLKNHLAGHLHKGRIFPTYRQARDENGGGTVTGRFSCARPNIQQIPARDKDLGTVVRSLFIPDKGQVLMTIDASNIDARMAMHYHNDPAIIMKFLENPDFDVYKAVSEITGLPRNAEYAGGPNSKALTLGLFFAQSAGRTAKELGLPYTVRKGTDGRRDWLEPGPEALAIFAKFHGMFPKVIPTNNAVKKRARTEGFLTVFGMRRLRFPNPLVVYKAVGSLYQAAAAVVHRAQLVDVYRETRMTGNHIVLAVHDELVLSVENDPVFHKRIQEIFDAPRFGLRIPLRSKIGTGPNWWIAGGK